MKYGRLTVKETFIVNGRRKALCICDCGKEKIVQMTHLKSGATTSCGCYHKERVLETQTKHNGKGTSLYNRWKAMKQRCNNPKNASYKNYGGRGITICEEWQEFESFKKWADESGYNKELDLDRIDNSKGYEPSNCRWVTRLTNTSNRRVTIKVEGLTLREISDKFNLEYTKVHYFYHRYKPTTIKQLLIYANQLPTSQGIG